MSGLYRHKELLLSECGRRPTMGDRLRMLAGAIHLLGDSSDREAITLPSRRSLVDWLACAPQPTSALVGYLTDDTVLPIL